MLDELNCVRSLREWAIKRVGSTGALMQKDFFPQDNVAVVWRKGLAAFEVGGRVESVLMHFVGDFLRVSAKERKQPILTRGVLICCTNASLSAIPFLYYCYFLLFIFLSFFFHHLYHYLFYIIIYFSLLFIIICIIIFLHYILLFVSLFIAYQYLLLIQRLFVIYVLFVPSFFIL